MANFHLDSDDIKLSIKPFKRQKFGNLIKCAPTFVLDTNKLFNLRVNVSLILDSEEVTVIPRGIKVNGKLVFTKNTIKFPNLQLADRETIEEASGDNKSYRLLFSFGNVIKTTPPFTIV